jgi:hypothetical protein
VTRDEYEAGLLRAGEIQRAAGWSEESIASYAKEHREITGDGYDCILIVGAGLAQDNSRHGVSVRRCNMGVECEENGTCYAEANGNPEMCGKTRR